MKALADIRHTKEMLKEAIEMLETLSDQMAMFQRQQYGKLRRRSIIINRSTRICGWH